MSFCLTESLVKNQILTLTFSRIEIFETYHLSLMQESTPNKNRRPCKSVTGVYTRLKVSSCKNSCSHTTVRSLIKTPQYETPRNSAMDPRINRGTRWKSCTYSLVLSGLHLPLSFTRTFFRNSSTSPISSTDVKTDEPPNRTLTQSTSQTIQFS